jgi:hypothetical protein
MDIRLNRTEFRNKIGSVSNSRRVRKPDREEPEQEQKKFADQLDIEVLKNKDDENSPEEDDNTGSQNLLSESDEEDVKLLPAKKENPDNLGRHIDIKV